MIKDHCLDPMQAEVEGGAGDWEVIMVKRNKKHHNSPISGLFEGNVA